MLRILVAGFGYWGPNLLRNFTQCAMTRPVAVCDRDPARLAQAQRLCPWLTTFSDFDEALTFDIDAVAVATPVATHYSLAARALAASKHVLIEKPIAANSAQALDLIDLAGRRGLVLMVDHTFLYSGAVRRIRELVQGGELGEIYYIDSVRINLGLVQHDINVLWDLAPHDLAILDYVLDRSPRTVAATGKAHVNDQADVAHIHLDYSNRLLATMHVNWLSPVKIRHLLIGGSEKSLLYNDLDPIEKIRVYDRGVRVTEDPAGRYRALVDYRSGDVWSPHVSTEEPLQVVVRHFAECILEGQQPMTDGLAGLRVVELLEAADRSMRAGGNAVSAEPEGLEREPRRSIAA